MSTASTTFPTDIMEICKKNKATEIAHYHIDTEQRIADNVIIATIGSTRVMESLTEDIREYLKSHRLMPPHGVPRHDHSGWIVIDCGTLIVHLCAGEKREYYRLDDIYRTPAGQ